MKLLTLLVCFSVYVGCSKAHVYEACPAGWMNFGKSCYRYFGQTLNYITAENVCRMFSGCGGGIGHLVSINDRIENDFIFNHLKSTSGLNPPPPTWLGGRRTPGTDRWVWSDGTPIMPYSAWVNSQAPQDQGRNCMVYGETQQPLWMHVNCANQQLPYICEMRANIPVDPATCVPNNPGVGAQPSPIKVGAQPSPIKVEAKPSTITGAQPGPIKVRYVPFRYNRPGNVEQRHSARP